MSDFADRREPAEGQSDVTAPCGYAGTCERPWATLHDPLEVWVRVVAVKDGTLCYGWNVVYSGSDMDVAINSARKAKLKGAEVVKIEWHGDILNSSSDDQAPKVNPPIK